MTARKDRWFLTRDWWVRFVSVLALGYLMFRVAGCVTPEPRVGLRGLIPADAIERCILETVECRFAVSEFQTNNAFGCKFHEPMED